MDTVTDCSPMPADGTGVGGSPCWVGRKASPETGRPQDTEPARGIVCAADGDDTLTDEQRAILALERQFWRTSGAKEDAIRAMGLSPVRYYQLLVGLLDDPAALAAEPQLIYRLRRIARR